MIDLREYARLLGYPPGRALEGDVLARAEEAAAWYRRNGKPRSHLRIEAGRVYAAFTAGFEAEEEAARLWSLGRVDESCFLDRLAAGVVERMARELGPHQSPGYPGFPIEEQHAVFRKVAPPPSSMRILPSGVLSPKNSLLAVYRIGAEDDGKAPCSHCGLRRCSFRRIAA